MRVIDLFAGAGGFSEGARMAGCSVVWAGNHWPVAVEWHGANHPETLHVCQDLRQADWTQIPDHDLLLASPACQGHSRARGKDKPHHDATRSTAWAVVDALEAKRPPLALIENVVDFTRWELFDVWALAIERLGYTMTRYILDAANHVVPQNRERLFMVLTHSRAPLLLSLPKHQHIPFAGLIDYRAGQWSPVRKPGRSAATLARWENGRREFGERFLLPYYSSARTGRSLTRPIGTITTRDRYAVVDGDRMRMLTADEYRAGMGFPADYKLPADHKTAVHLLGNAVCPPVAADLIRSVLEAAA